MTRRTKELLGEMQDIFGNSFGSEGEALDEIRGAGKPMPDVQRGRKSASPKGKKALFKGKDKKNKGGDKETRKAKKRGKAALKAFHQDKERGFQKRKQEIDKKAKKSPKKSDAVSPGGSGSRPEKKQSGRSLSQKSAQRHFPFKRSSDLGPGPRGRKHRETKCWKCKCGNVYRDGCHCISTGTGANCPDKGTMKQISYKSDYKQSYNRQYHSWRAAQGARATQKLGARKTAL